jgi:hypothetical protein
VAKKVVHQVAIYLIAKVKLWIAQM